MTLASAKKKSNNWYISEHAKMALLEYKYHSMDHSLASYYMQNFWEYCVTFLPMWMAPNLVTVIGFLCVCLNTSILIFLSPNLNSHLPRWAYFSAAFATFIYQTLDAIDGKQARRTGSSSALGELFDHCVDALVTLLHAITFMICLEFGDGWLAYLFIVVTFITSYTCIWENYYTDEMTFQYWSSPTEALLFSIFLFIGQGIIGRISLYSSTLLNIIPGNIGSVIRGKIHAALNGKYLLGVVEGFSIRHLIFIFGCIMAFSSASASFETVLKSSLNNRKKGYFYGAITTFLPIVFALTLFTMFLKASSEDLLHSHIISVLFGVGLIASYVQCRLVVARICDEKVTVFPFILYPLVPMIIHQILDLFIFTDSQLLHMYLLYTLLCYSHFAWFTISEICEHLQIQAFTLGYLKDKKKTE